MSKLGVIKPKQGEKHSRFPLFYDEELDCYVHGEDQCGGNYCSVHNPSDHHMKDWPRHFRMDRGFTERISPSGIGHPDPDDVAFFAKMGKDISVHGCDGSCSEENK